jgi:hypothetical protein
MAQFSGAVKIADLNDFIAPSQSCVVSLKGNKVQIGNDEQVRILYIRKVHRRWYQRVCVGHYRPGADTESTARCRGFFANKNI